MTSFDTIFIALIMLLGIEGKHYLIFERDIDEWSVLARMHRN